MTRSGDDGVVLINVLVLLALAASVVTMMLSLADLSIARSQRFSEAGQALALIRAGEASAIAALRRDMIEAPEVDHRGEAWAAVGQRGIEIAGGTFELEIADAQGRFNLNALVGGGLQAVQTLQAIAAELELAPETAARIAATINVDGPLRELGDLSRRAGIPAGEVDAMRGLVTVLPGNGDVNVNAAPPELLAILLQNPVQARVLAATRERAGFLTPQDVEAAGVILPPGVGFASDFFQVRTSVRIGETPQVMESLLQRRRGATAARRSRWWGAETQRRRCLHRRRRRSCPMGCCPPYIEVPGVVAPGIGSLRYGKAFFSSAALIGAPSVNGTLPTGALRGLQRPRLTLFFGMPERLADRQVVAEPPHHHPEREVHGVVARPAPVREARQIAAGHPEGRLLVARGRRDGGVEPHHLGRRDRLLLVQPLEAGQEGGDEVLARQVVRREVAGCWCRASCSPRPGTAGRAAPAASGW